MFKKGQIVKHRQNGRLFRVERCGANLIVLTNELLDQIASNPVWYELAEQAKPKCSR